MKVQPTKNQSILDLSLIFSGDVEEAFQIAVANGMSITDNPLNITGVAGSIDLPKVRNQRIAGIFGAAQNKPATYPENPPANTITLVIANNPTVIVPISTQ